MSSVPRYNPAGYSVGMEAAHEGGYVQWHEYLELTMERDALQAKLDAAEAMNHQQALNLMAQESARIAAEAKLDAVTKDAEALRADIREIYEQIPNLPITPETMDAATDVLTKFCIDFNATITGSDHE